MSPIYSQMVPKTNTCVYIYIWLCKETAKANEENCKTTVKSE